MSHAAGPELARHTQVSDTMLWHAAVLVSNSTQCNS